jgi:inhibitor of KinA
MIRTRFPRILPLGDSAVTIEFGGRIGPAIHERVLACMTQLDQEPLHGQLECVPTYRSLTVYYDPLLTDGESVGAGLRDLAAHPARVRRKAAKTVTVPVFYDPGVAPDLEAVAAEAHVKVADLITLHTSVTYRVYMIGFMPGFPYLGLVPQRIAVPRLATPRKTVPAGSVGIAGNQSGIYPRASPGGWRIIGRTPIRICDLAASRPFLFEAGDQVRFIPIDPAEFKRLSEENQ